MPNSNIDKAIKKGVGELDNVIIEEVSYEGLWTFWSSNTYRSNNGQ